ncbi:MAG TPA: hypothetical protein VLU46_12160 [Thermoanaerobaculia bacterium]|nr:hypothetical protein [Thermoanaerobaculia bacterium]
MNAALLILLLLSSAQTSPQTEPPHDITKVDPVAPDAAIATPLPREREKQLRKYGLDDLAGSTQAIGSQLIDGRLPRPLLDYYVHNGTVDQRVSIFERGLVVVRMAGAGGTIQKRVLIPDGAMKKYLAMAAPDKLAQLGPKAMAQPRENRGAFLRVYRDPTSYVERLFDPSSAKPKILNDAVMPLEDLLRAISEDRTVTNTIANYEPAVGDELVGDDRKTWRVVRIMKDAEEVVELHCTSQPTIMYVAKKDLYNYFIGRAAQQ